MFGTRDGRDRFYRFLQTVFHLFPEDRLHGLIAAEVRKAEAADHDDEAIYRAIQAQLPSVTPKLAAVTHAIPALATQKAEMLRQTLELLGGMKPDGYLEIGTTGRYVGGLRKQAGLTGPVYLLHSAAPTNSPVDILERGGLGKVGTFIPHADDTPISHDDIPDASLDLVTCYPGLHHLRPDAVAPSSNLSIGCYARAGWFVLRDHHVPDIEMNSFVALVHTVFNMGTGVDWPENAAEPRNFQPLDHWVRLIEAAGLTDSGARLLQANDPSDNTLMAFRKVAA